MRDVLLVAAGGMFGVVLGELLGAAPRWLFFLLVAAFLLVAVVLIGDVV